MLAMLIGALLLAGCGSTRTVTRLVTVTRAELRGPHTIIGVNINNSGAGRVSETPNLLKLTPPSGLRGQALAEYRAGEQVATQAGCLGCHVIGRDGNNGPGPPLTRIGARLTSAQLLATLRHPSAPMPSFAGLPHRKLTALVAFLSALR